MPILPGTARNAYLPTFHQQVLIWRRYIDPATAESHVVNCELDGQPCVSLQDTREHRRRLSRQMDHDENGGRKIAWQRREDSLKSLNPSCRRTHDYYLVSIRQRSSQETTRPILQPVLAVFKRPPVKDGPVSSLILASCVWKSSGRVPQLSFPFVGQWFAKQQ
jgi:hypothetical protein